MKRSRPNSVRLFLISSILFSTASLASAQITFLNDPYQISFSDGQNNGHTMCYNPTRNEYLVAYMSFPTTSRRVIQYFRLNSTGTKIGGHVDVIDNLEGSSGPSVCYNSARQEYLISYQGYTSAGGLHSELRIQRVNAINGALIGGSTLIQNSPTVIATKVAYSPTSDSYLLVWEDQATVPWPVYGLRLSSTAGSLGSIFNISNGTYKYAGDPAISYNSVNNEYLVSFQTYLEPDPGNTCWNLYAQRVRASDGALLGGNIAIGATTQCETGASIGYDSNMNRYLVVYEGAATSPWGQFISNTGTLVGSRFDIGISPFNGGMTGVTWNSLTREWFVTWASCCSADNWALRLTQTGSPIGNPLPLTGAVQGFGNWDPVPVYNSTNNEFLICWFWQYAAVYVRRAQTEAAPPGPVTNFAASSSSGQNLLSWTNPSDPSFTGTLIRYRTDTYPTSPTDGTLVIDKANSPGTNDSHVHGGLTNGVTYYYSAWAHNSTPLYSNVRNANGTPTPPLCFSDSFAYANGNLNGNGGWSGSAGSQIQVVSQTVKINAGAGGVDSNRTVSCGDPGTGFIQISVKVQSGSGVSNMWNLWFNDPAGINICRWYGAGTTAKGRIGSSGIVTPTQTLTGGWDNLLVKINPIAKTAEFFFNSASIGVLDYSSQGAANTLGKLRFERSGGPSGDFLSFDDLVVGDPGSPPPGQATNPSPANGATLVPITSTLTWTAGSGATSHDVRFGTANPPPFIQNQAGTSYTPPTMTPNTTYFWRIDEKNGSGTTTGTVWSFTTLPLPGQASAPSPANGATLVPITSSVSWTAGSNANSHDVRFGTANPPPFIQNQAGTSYTPPTMTPNTTYFWRIDEKNSSGTTTGTVWSFTTLPLPGLATAPSPANGATGVSITATLSWTAGSNASSHDVRFGTANPPPFIQNQAGTTYNPGTLSPGTTYFWRIDEKNSSGTTTGTVWSFTTAGALPGLATNPNPANGATGVSVAPTLSWTAGSGATSHDVRFGTVNPPPFIQNQAGTSYAPGALIGATTYFWRIDEKNGSGTTTGTVWSFTTTSCFNDAFAYANGNLNGNGSWTGTATSQIQILSQMVRINGGASSFDANRTISCTGTGGIIQVHVKVQGGTGVDNMWSLWFDDPAGINICRWYGAGTTARGRIGGSGLVTGVQTLTGGLDTLLVKINTTAKTAEFFFNGASIGTLDYTGQGAANTLGRLRFERLNHSGATGNFLNFDNLTVY